MNNSKLKSTKKSTKTYYPNISCPRCGSHYLRKYGKEQKTKLQKYQCKHCLKQFVPNKQKTYHITKQHKHGNCPICCSRLDLRKSNKNSIQLRCSNRPLCKFTISYNTKLNKFYYNTINELNTKLKLPKFFKFNLQIVLFALRLYFKYKLPLRTIKNEIKFRFPNCKPPSHVTIAKWANKFSYLLSVSIMKPTFNLSNNWLIWATDETVIKINGTKHYLVLVTDLHSNCVLSYFLSPTRDTQTILHTLKLALNLTKSKPNIIVSDHAQNISNAVNTLFKNSVFHYKTSIFNKNPTLSNNKLERLFSNIKSKLNNRRQFKSLTSAYLFLSTFFIIHNLNCNFKTITHNLINHLNIKHHLVRSLLLCIA